MVHAPHWARLYERPLAYASAVPKLFIAGHSDSGDAFLPADVLPWPERTQAWLSEGGPAWELSSARFAAMGPRAVGYLLRKVEAEQPDVVVLPLGGFVCTVGSVAESVRVRFGERAARLFRQSEVRFETRTREGQLRRRVNTLSRRAARRVLGARTLATLEETTGIYREVLHELAKVESIQVVAVRDARFSSWIQEFEPRLHERFDAMERELLPIVAEHRFVLADLEGALQRAPDRRVFHLEDGVHTTAAFHEVYFGVMREALAELRGVRTA